MVQTNLGNALPHTSPAQRVISKQRKIVEGEFYFEVLSHLKTWNAALFVHIHLDVTRIINKVEYDPATDRFVGFCLPLCNGLPIGDSFVFSTFKEIQNAFHNEVIGKYAHVMVAKPVHPLAPALIIFIICTDAKYNHNIIQRRYVENELRKQVSG